jgi:hypothetical protein
MNMNEREAPRVRGASQSTRRVVDVYVQRISDASAFPAPEIGAALESRCARIYADPLLKAPNRRLSPVGPSGVNLPATEGGMRLPHNHVGPPSDNRILQTLPPSRVRNKSQRHCVRLRSKATIGVRACRSTSTVVPIAGIA